MVVEAHAPNIATLVAIVAIGIGRAVIVGVGIVPIKGTRAEEYRAAVEAMMIAAVTMPIAVVIAPVLRVATLAIGALATIGLAGHCRAMSAGSHRRGGSAHGPTVVHAAAHRSAGTAAAPATASAMVLREGGRADEDAGESGGRDRRNEFGFFEHDLHLHCASRLCRVKVPAARGTWQRASPYWIGMPDTNARSFTFAPAPEI